MFHFNYTGSVIAGEPGKRVIVSRQTATVPVDFDGTLEHLRNARNDAPTIESPGRIGWHEQRFR